jgi:hypothetical protein
MTITTLLSRISSLCVEAVKLRDEIETKTASYKKYHAFEWGQIDGAGRYAKAILEYLEEYSGKSQEDKPSMTDMSKS